MIAALSFFGMKQTPLVLSPEFRYRRRHMISSQVSSLGAGLEPSWSRERSNAAAFDLLRRDGLLTPASHALPFSQAPEANTIFDKTPDEAMGIVLKY